MTATVRCWCRLRPPKTAAAATRAFFFHRRPGADLRGTVFSSGSVCPLQLSIFGDVILTADGRCPRSLNQAGSRPARLYRRRGGPGRGPRSLSSAITCWRSSSGLTRNRQLSIRWRIDWLISVSWSSFLTSDRLPRRASCRRRQNTCPGISSLASWEIKFSHAPLL